jgi:hypothetical protein
MASTNPFENRKPVVAGTVVVTWAIGGTVYTLTDQGDGTLTGHGTGEISYYNGKLTLKPNPAPRVADGNYSVTFDEWSGGSKMSATEAPINGTLNKTLPGAVEPGSLVIRAAMLQYPEAVTSTLGTAKRRVDIVIRDDGVGNLKRYGGGVNGLTVGTVNYATGALAFDVRANYKYQTQNQQSIGSL